MTIDGTALAGVLNVNTLGGECDNLITVSSVSPQGSVNINGANTFSTVTIGTGQLALIQGAISVTNAALNIDDSQATTPSILTMTNTTFSGWAFPSATVKLTYSDLGFGNDVNVFAGPGDRFDLEGVPLNVLKITFLFAGLTNPPDAFYVPQLVTLVDSIEHVILDGGFALFLGERLSADGTVTKLDNLQGLANASITYESPPPQELRIYPNLGTFWNPIAQSYSIGGTGDFIVTDESINLTVVINGYRNDDQVLLDLPGGTVDADLDKDGAGRHYDRWIGAARGRQRVGREQRHGARAGRRDRSAADGAE